MQSMDVHSITICILAIIVLIQEVRINILNRRFMLLISACKSLDTATGHLSDAIKQITEHMKQQDRAVNNVFQSFVSLTDAINKAKEAIQKELNNE